MKTVLLMTTPTGHKNGYSTSKKEEGIDELNEEHTKVVEVLREYYEKNGIAPMVRVLSKVTGFKLKHIYELFPSGPGKGACKMAGLPKPTGCV
jgi:TusE/DsrC/DsvC family sulfur relay protein